MKELEALERIKESIEEPYNLVIHRFHSSLQHVEVLIEDYTGFVAYFNISFDSNKLNIFDGKPLDLPSKFVRLYNMIDGR